MKSIHTGFTGPAFVSTLVMLAAALHGTNLGATVVEWPHDVQTSQAAISVYQPQPESLKAGVLTGRRPSLSR